MMAQFLFTLAVFFLFSCHSADYSSGKKSGEPTIKDLLAAPDTIRIESTSIILQTYLWRDFMPASPPDGKPLRAAISLLPVLSGYLPTGIDARRIWIIHQEEVWSSSLSEVSPVTPDQPLSRLEKTASNGPKWGPGVDVIVVVELIDHQGKSYLLRADKQAIHRTV